HRRVRVVPVHHLTWSAELRRRFYGLVPLGVNLGFSGDNSNPPLGGIPARQDRDEKCSYALVVAANPEVDIDVGRRWSKGRCSSSTSTGGWWTPFNTCWPTGRAVSSVVVTGVCRGGNMSGMETLEAIRARRSVRAYVSCPA